MNIPPSLNLWPFSISCFSLTLWLGAFLLKRNSQHLGILCISIASLAYASTQCLLILSSITSFFQPFFIELNHWLLLSPAIFIIGVLLFALPEELHHRNLLHKIYSYGLVPFFLFSTISATLLSNSIPPILPLLLKFLILCISLCIVAWLWKPLYSTQRTLFLLSGILSMSTILTFPWFPYIYTHVLPGGLLFALGLYLAMQDAHEQGEAFLPDLFRSFDYAMLTALILGGQIILIMLLSTGPTLLMLLLVQSTIATAIFAQVFSNKVVAILDSIAFATFPQLRQERTKLHTTLDVLPRIQPENDPTHFDEAEFTRFTRQALSHMGNLPRLATSPLMQLPLIKNRLHDQGLNDQDVLAQAAELKLLLTESILKLKPHNKGDFDTSDEWRYYNALYFPYVMGIKPYNSRSQHHASDQTTQKALDWFRTQIPERTLHNWQKSAAKLVAQDLLHQETTKQEILVPKKVP